MDSAQPDAQSQTTSPSNVDTPAPPRRTATNDDFLVSGPTPESNAGLGRWGLSWLMFSVVLMLVMLGMSFMCWLVASALGIS